MNKKILILTFILAPVLFACTTSQESGSRFGGVQIGVITYSWRDLPGGVDNIIKYCKESGITSIELMSTDVEAYLGAPENPMRAIMAARMAARTAQQPGQGAPQQQGGARPEGQTAPPPPPPPPPSAATAGQPATAPAGGPPAGGFRRFEMTPEQQAAVDEYNAELKEWRLSVPMSKFEELGKMFRDQGINVPIVKFSPARWSDEEIDYAFRAAKAMGAKGVTEEIGEEAVKRLAPFAEKHGMYAIFHNHMQFAEPGFSYDDFLSVSPAVMFNFDAGHFYGSTGIHPNTIIEKYHERIFSVHLKDKTGPQTEPANENQVWGQGEVPIEDVLLLIKEKGWPIYCDIELEYPVKPWSTSVKEVRTCVRYARQILM